MVWAVCSLDGDQPRSNLSWTDDDPNNNINKKTTTAAEADAGGPFACFHPGKGDKSSAEFLECDYEKNCTPLYRAIEDEDWEHVNHFLLHGYWPGKLFYDATSAADQARTWVTRYAATSGGGGDHNQGVVLWSQLPLHLCCILNAPYEVVSRLLEIYPAAARSLDDQTNLPLHILLQRGASDRIVDLLLISFPEAVNVKGKNGLTPLECADDKMVHGRVFRAIFGLDGSGGAAASAAAVGDNDQASVGGNSLVTDNRNKATATTLSSNHDNTFFGNFAHTLNGGSSAKGGLPAAAAADHASSSSLSTSKARQQTVTRGKNESGAGDQKVSADLNSLEVRTNMELAELRKELQAVAKMAESRADVNELKAEIQNLCRQLRAKEHSAAAAVASAQQEQQRLRGGRRGSKGKGKNKKSSSSSWHGGGGGGVERPRSPFSRRKSGVTTTRHSGSSSSRPGVQKSLSWSKQLVDNTDSVSLHSCSSVVSSRHHEFEVAMLPQVSMLDGDSSSSDDDDDDEETESSSEHEEQPPLRQQQQQEQEQERSKKKKNKQSEKRRKKLSQQQQQHQRQKKQQQLLQQDIDSDQTDHDIILAHHPRQVESRCQCVIL